MSSVEAGTTRSRGSRRRRVSSEEERTIAQLYAEASTPTAEIRVRFGIGDASLYRVLHRQGVALRGRTAAGVGATRIRTSTRRGKNSAASAAPGTIAMPAAPSDGKRAASRRGDAKQQRFRIRFQAHSVFDAPDLRDALRQAESLGAIEITAVIRQT